MYPSLCVAAAAAAAVEYLGLPIVLVRVVLVEKRGAAVLRPVVSARFLALLALRCSPVVRGVIGYPSPAFISILLPPPPLPPGIHLVLVEVPDLEVRSRLVGGSSSESKDASG